MTNPPKIIMIDDSTIASPPQQQPQTWQVPLFFSTAEHSATAVTFFLERTFFRVGISSLVILGLSHLSTERVKACFFVKHINIRWKTWFLDVCPRASWSKKSAFYFRKFIYKQLGTTSWTKKSGFDEVMCQMRKSYKKVRRDRGLGGREKGTSKDLSSCFWRASSLEQESLEKSLDVLGVGTNSCCLVEKLLREEVGEGSNFFWRCSVPRRVFGCWPNKGIGWTQSRGAYCYPESLVSSSP